MYNACIVRNKLQILFMVHYIIIFIGVKCFSSHLESYIILYWVKQWISLVTEIWNIWNTYAICRNDDGCVHKSLKVYRYRLKSVSTISCAAMQLSMQIRSTKCYAFSGLMLKLTSIIAGPGITRQWIWLRLLKANIQQ